MTSRFRHVVGQQQAEVYSLFTAKTAARRQLQMHSDLDNYLDGTGATPFDAFYHPGGRQ